MKKTIIALMALAGVTYGATTGSEFNTELAEAITLKQYTYGQAFSVELSLYVKDHMSNNTGFLKFADNGWIVNQTHNYFGINTTDSNNITEVAGTYTKEIEGYNYTYTASSISPLWCQSPTLDGSASRGPIWNNEDNLGVTIATDGKDSWVTITYDETSSIIDTWKFTGVVLDAQKITLDSNLSVVSSTFSVPEPTTATLSLLALAGLAARRRRK